jgi:3-hydroxyacyl-[acyl-carrier-protein] dehydratase
MSIASVTLPVSADHPAYAGHFPGMPVLPGVVLLDEALHAIGTALEAGQGGWRINSIKFLVPVKPGQPLEVRFERADSGAVRFDILSEDRKVATGMASASGPIG